MKTTIDIADDLASRARELAHVQGRTFRSVVEQGLRLVLEEARAAKPYRLPDRSFHGRGLQREFAAARWPDILEAAYRGRGH